MIYRPWLWSASWINSLVCVPSMSIQTTHSFEIGDDGICNCGIPDVKVEAVVKTVGSSCYPGSYITTKTFRCCSKGMCAHQSCDFSSGEIHEGVIFKIIEHLLSGHEWCREGEVLIGVGRCVAILSALLKVAPIQSTNHATTVTKVKNTLVVTDPRGQPTVLL